MDTGILDTPKLAKLTTKTGANLGKSKGSNGPTKNGKSRKEAGKPRGDIKAQSRASSNRPANAGTKRDIQGKARVRPQIKDNTSKQGDGGTHEGSATQQGQDQFRQLVFELGGTEEDLDLFGGGESASEIDEGETNIPQTNGVRTKLNHDVASFVHSLGIADDAPPRETPMNEDDSRKSQTKKQAGSKPKVKDVENRAKPKPAEDQIPERVALMQKKEAKSKARSPRLTFEPRPDWHTAELPRMPILRDDASAPPQPVLQRLHDHARHLLQQENAQYASAEGTSSSSGRFLKTIMTSGTLSDKISALTLVIQESPLHTMKALDNLLALSRKRSRGQAVSALGALKDLFGRGELLPSTRRLRVFSSQSELIEALQDPQSSRWTPGESLPGQVKDAHLVCWAFEDWLKATYYDVVRLLEVWCNDEVEYAKSTALAYVYDLLTQKPEQEANLLRLLVNKLGDSDKKIASKASYLLLRLSAAHPLMKPIIASTLESDLIFRPRQSPHAIYYATITLNQTELSGREEEVAQKLLDLYFRLFAMMLRDREEPDARPHEGADDKKTARKGKAVPSKHKGKTKTKKGAAEATNKQDEEIKEKVISAVLTGVNRALPFSGSDGSTFQNHLDMLFKITHSSNFNSSVQALTLLQQLSVSHRASSDRFYRTLYESLLDPRLLTTSKQAMYLNLLFRSLRADLHLKRVKAFVKRIVQLTALHQPPFACAALYLVKELEEIFGGLHSMIDQPEGYFDGDEEHFQDVPEVAEASGSAIVTLSASTARSANAEDQGARYDGRKRDPQYCNADRSCLWEVLPCLGHFHPSVKLFASRLLFNEQKPPKPDLSLHTLIHFLDRFVYRNVRTTSAPRGVSIMQPLQGQSAPGMVLLNRDSSKAKAPLNVAAFLAKKSDEVSADEVFFHKYFSQVGYRKQFSERKAARKAKQSADDEDEDKAGDDDEVWKAIVGSRTELADDGDEDGDLDLDDPELSDDSEAVEIFDDDSTADGDLAFDSDVGLPADQQQEYDGQALFSSEDEEQQPDIPRDAPAKGKPGRGNDGDPSREDRRAKRRKLKALPTFAEAEDYAGMLAEEEEEYA